MPTVRLIGGPCDGQTLSVPDPPPVGTIVGCGGHDYAYQSDGAFHDLGVAGGGAGGAAVKPSPQIVHGWHDLQRAINRRLPTALSNSQHYRRAAIRKLRQRRR
jgi:hypothetical protein